MYTTFSPCVEFTIYIHKIYETIIIAYRIDNLSARLSTVMYSIISGYSNFALKTVSGNLFTPQNCTNYAEYLLCLLLNEAL